MTKMEIQKEIEELEFELCHDVGLLTKAHIEKQIKELKKELKSR